MPRAKLQVIHDSWEQMPDVYVLFMHLGDVEINVRPGEVTSMQELRAVSSLCMHSPECTMQQSGGDAASHQNNAGSMIYGQTGDTLTWINTVFPPG